VKAFMVKTNKGLFLGNDEAIFVFMTRDLAEQRLMTTEADLEENFRIIEVNVEEVQ